MPLFFVIAYSKESPMRANCDVNICNDFLIFDNNFRSIYWAHQIEVALAHQDTFCPKIRTFLNSYEVAVALGNCCLSTFARTYFSDVQPRDW